MTKTAYGSGKIVVLNRRRARRAPRVLAMLTRRHVWSIALEGILFAAGCGMDGFFGGVFVAALGLLFAGAVFLLEVFAARD